MRSLFVLLLVLVTVGDAQALSKICENPDVSPYAWGEDPTGCDAKNFGDVSRISYIYKDFVFDRRTRSDETRQHYMTNVVNLVTKMAYDYYKQRKPEAGPIETAIFVRGVLATAARESHMSHYRIGPDGRYKLMTGDKVISHGMMQINQNFKTGTLDSSFDLVGNIAAGLDTFYVEWNRAPSQDCYSWMTKEYKTADRKFEDRARSAYSAYNGGPDSICRYSNRKSPYLEHDEGFKDQFEAERWKRWNIEPQRPIPVNIKCLLAGDDVCAIAQSNQSGFIKDHLLVYDNGLTCYTTDGINLSCAKDARTLRCMAKISPEILDRKPMKVAKMSEIQKATIIENRTELCSKAVKGLFSLGQKIIVKKQSNIRDDIGGEAIDMTQPDNIYEVLDFDVRLGEKTDRYYLVRIDDETTGWIYAGSDDDHDEWAVFANEENLAARERRLAQRKEAEAAKTKPSSNGGEVIVIGNNSVDKSIIPHAGQVIEIVYPEGINLRDAIGSETVLTNLPKSARVQVDQVITKGSENEIYLRVLAAGKTGFIYAGHTFPEVTVQNWVKVVE